MRKATLLKASGAHDSVLQSSDKERHEAPVANCLGFDDCHGARMATDARIVSLQQSGLLGGEPARPGASINKEHHNGIYLYKYMREDQLL
jgi:hypothetical protein